MRRHEFRYISRDKLPQYKEETAKLLARAQEALRLNRFDILHDCGPYQIMAADELYECQRTEPQRDGPMTASECYPNRVVVYDEAQFIGEFPNLDVEKLREAKRFLVKRTYHPDILRGRDDPFKHEARRKLKYDLKRAEHSETGHHYSPRGTHKTR